jgi:hypothetical protein
MPSIMIQFNWWRPRPARRRTGITWVDFILCARENGCDIIHARETTGPILFVRERKRVWYYSCARKNVSDIIRAWKRTACARKRKGVTCASENGCDLCAREKRLGRKRRVCVSEDSMTFYSWLTWATLFWDFLWGIKVESFTLNYSDSLMPLSTSRSSSLTIQTPAGGRLPMKTVGLVTGSCR